MELKKYKLEECCLHITDGEHGSVNDDLQGDYYLLSNKNIINGNIVISKDDRKINKATFDKINKRILLEEKDVIISTVGTLGKTAIIEGNINYTFQRSVGIIKPNPQIIDSHYLKYLLDTDYYQQLLIGLSVGAVQKCIFIGTLKSLPISIPSLPTQKKIANILQTLDQKIALNRQINDNLEAMAKQLYDYWFVQFDFPNEEGKPYKSSGGKMVYNQKLKREIPEGWEVDKVSSLINPIERGISYSSDNLLDNTATPMINLACFSKSGDYRTGEMKFYSRNIPENKSIEPMDMLIACTDMTQNADIIGRPIFASHEFKKYTFSTDLAKLQTKSNMKMYLYYTLRTSFYHKYIRPFASGTNVKHLNLSGVENYVISIPPETIQLNFEKIILPIKNKQSKILNEIASLTKQRDELLPLLMNGQVSVD